MFQPAPAGIVDRAAEEREQGDLLEKALADPRTRVLLIHGDSAPRATDGLGWLSPDDVAELVGSPVDWAFLGRDDEGSAVLLAAARGRERPIPDLGDGWASLRETATSLPAPIADLFTVAVSLGRFLGERFCSRCGTQSPLATSGWSRSCPECGAEHFPRTDPAVIVATESRDGERLLLGANAVWKGRMYSCFAGFVEAGESLETAVHRELLEEAGVRLKDVRYVASQPWPYPRSLMLGYRATAAAEHEVRPDGTEIIDVRWFTRDEIRSGLAGRADFGLPGPVSIAHRLIAEWAQEGRATDEVGGA
ncbi:NAD(+) diphosphatase [Microbacterium halotolerans]|uniref:NAD(+) diphosphatase n=1 Tax=Microbacterium halotolerans TaxID=246613 RepID=UPI000E6AAC60|nr:NAD(+) diphosphatase [Microbacterium halotolerans]